LSLSRAEDLDILGLRAVTLVNTLGTRAIILVWLRVPAPEAGMRAETLEGTAFCCHSLLLEAENYKNCS
jgi:hypothetical protein